VSEIDRSLDLLGMAPSPSVACTTLPPKSSRGYNPEINNEALKIFE